MNKISTLAVLALLSAAYTGNLFAQNPNTLELTDALGISGGTVDVKIIWSDTGTASNTVDFQIAYNPAEFTLNTCTTFPDSWTFSGCALDAVQGEGTLDFAVLKVPGPVTGSGGDSPSHLATVTFNVLAGAGSYNINIDPTYDDLDPDADHVVTDDGEATDEINSTVTVQGPSYNSINPAPGGNIMINGFAGGGDQTHTMEIDNDGVGTLTGSCGVSGGDAANFGIGGDGANFSVDAAGPNHMLGVICEIGTDSLTPSTYNTTLVCTHENGDDMPASPIEYAVTCNVSDAPFQELTLVKNALTGDFDAPGDTLSYEFTVTSSGNIPVALPMVIDDDLTTNESCPAVDTSGNNDNMLDPGENIVCTASYVTNQGDVDNALVENCATASADGVVSNESCDAVQGIQTPGITLSKGATQQPGADGLMHPGDTILYGFQIENTGNVTLSNVTLSDPLPGLGSFNCPPGHPIPTMAPGQILTCNASYSVTQDDIDAEQVFNVAQVEADCPLGPGRTEFCISDDDDHNEIITQEPRIEITKSADPVEYGNAGEVITYTFVVTNTGNETLFSIDVTDPLITDAPNSGTIDCSPEANPIADLAPLESVQCTGEYTIQESDLDGDTLDNTATATADCELPPPARGEGEECASDTGDASIERTADAAHFIVTKDFNDDNTAGVEIVIECTTGLPMMSDATLYEFHDIFDKIDFIVQDYDPGELDCTIYEDVPEGYDPSYDAYDGEDAESGVDPYSDADGCHFEEVEGGYFHCDITNTLQEVTVVVDKIWIDDQAAENGEFLFAGAKWRCEPVADRNDVPWYLEPRSGHLTFHGFPHGYREAGDPSELWDFDTFSFFPHFEGSTCSVTEFELDANVFTDDSDCDDFEIFPGYDLDGEPECVIINTRIYAGIPTLSEYGLALLALLMLGIGFVGYRRFA